MRRIVSRGPVYYQFEQWAGSSSPVHGIFTRIGGTSGVPWHSLNVGSTVGDSPAAVERNKAIIEETLNLEQGSTCTVWQVHGHDTVVMNQPTSNGKQLIKADGMVTDKPGLSLVMRFADCVPVLFYDPVARVVGMAHAGWRGTVAGAGPSVANAMVATFGCRVEDIQAGIGPSIGPDHYRVGQDVVAMVEAAFPGSSGLIRHDFDGAVYLDLWEANRKALLEVGVIQIEVARICTASNTDEFFSHRAEDGKTGRFGAVIGLPIGVE